MMVVIGKSNLKLNQQTLIIDFEKKSLFQEEEELIVL